MSVDWHGQQVPTAVYTAPLFQPYRGQTVTAAQRRSSSFLMTNDVPFRVVEHWTFRWFVDGLNSVI